MDIDFTGFNAKDLENIININNKFSFFERKLKQLEFKISDTNGAWVFKMHTYSKEELIMDPDVEKLISAIRLLSDNLVIWVKNGSISDIGVNYYFNRQNEFIEKLEKLENAIINRPSYNWEKIQSLMKAVARMLIEAFPLIKTIGSGLAGLLDYVEKPQRQLKSGEENKSETEKDKDEW